MGLAIKGFDQAATNLQITLDNHGVTGAVHFKEALNALRSLLKEGETVQKAFDAVNGQIIRKAFAARKSEAEAVAAAVSQDFDIGPATPGQASAAATRSLQVQGLAQALGRRIQEMNPDMAAADVMAAVNLKFTSYEGEDGQTTSNSNPQVAASLRDLPADGTIWEPSDMADPRQRDMVDEEMAASPFGVRNQGYTNQRSAMGSGGFSGSGSTSVPAGTYEGATVADLSAAAVAAAYSAGVAAGTSNMAKRSRRGR